MGRLIARLAYRETGTTLIELLVVSTLLVGVVGATLTFLDFGARTQQRDQSFGQQLTTSQHTLARLMHDLREATKIVTASPNTVEFLLPVGTTTYDVKYDCTQPDSLGSGYTRCSRLQSVYPNPLPSPPATAGANDIPHVQNGGVLTYCKLDGSNQAGSIFFFQDATVPDTNISPPACDEPYQQTVAGLNPAYVQVLVKVPAGGGQPAAGATHSTELESGAFLQNLTTGS